MPSSRSSRGAARLAVAASYHRAMSRRALVLASLALASAALATGCCFGGGLPAPPTPPPPPPPSFTLDCAGLCARTGACLDERGQPRGADELDCARACAPGGTYAAMSSDAFACVSRPSCEDFDACTGQVVAAMLARALQGGAGATPPPPSAGPPGWPEGFPLVPGGEPMSAPPAGPVRVGIVGYAGRSADDLDAAYHQALEAAGWTAPPSQTSPRGAHRFQATRGASSIAVSIYAEGPRAIVQTMQF